VSQRMVYEWIERFKNGRTSIKHEEGARRRALFSLILPIIENEKTVFSSSSSLRVNEQCDIGVLLFYTLTL
jgi:hypothetical protein